MSENQIEGLSESFTREEYNSQEIFNGEMHKIYGTNWCFAGLGESLNKIGDRLVVDIGSESILILRNRESELRAYYNVCQHRGSNLCDASPQNSSKLVHQHAVAQVAVRATEQQREVGLNNKNDDQR